MCKENKNEPITHQPTPENKYLELLLSRLASGETGALEELYQATRASVFGLVFSFTHHLHDAEDVTHDTYVAIYQSAGRYEARGKPLAWMFTIAKNLARMKLRDRKRQDLFPENDEAGLMAENTNLSIEDKLVLQAYLEELKDEEQLIVVLRAISGWKHKDIAKFINMPVQHVIVKYSRAIKKLMRKYKQG